MDEIVLYDRYGQAVYRLCGSVFYDYLGKPRGLLVTSTVYDLRGQHRGFLIGGVLRDRMGRIVGFAEGARVEGLKLPYVDIPGVPYKNLPAPETPAGLCCLECPAAPPLWSVMRLENLLV